jgi:glycosidase
MILKKYLLTGLLYSILSFQLGLFAQNNIKVEPPFWWEDMAYNRLEILIYGKNISGLQPLINSQNIILKEVIRTGNPNYLFLDVQLTQDVSNGFDIKLNNAKGKTVYTYYYDLKKRNQNSADRQGFNSSDVIYLIMPDRFANGDTNNDSNSRLYEKYNRDFSLGRHGGDLKGVSDNLSYINDLGFTALWLNPVLENNQFNQTYHGYAITDFYSVDARLGTNSDYLTLIDNCHKKEIKVIMDMVFNHAGTQGRLVKDPPSSEWFNMWPKFTNSNYRGEVKTDLYASEFDITKMGNGWFDTTMADLNQANPHVLKYLIQNSIWWIEYANLDGIRMDTYPYPDKAAMSEWAKTIMKEYPNFNIIGETWLQLPSHTACWQENSKLLDSNNTYLKSVTDFPTLFAMNAAINETDSWTQGWARLYYILAQDFLYPNPQNLLIFPDNHDIERFANVVGGDINKFKLAMTFFLTSRGIPQIYYGTELMMESTPYIDHGSYRRDYPGGWSGDEKNAFTGEGLTLKEKEAREFLRYLLQWRKHKEVIHSGKLKHFIPENEVYVYCRYNNTETILVILNKNTQKTVIDLQRFSECTSKYKSGFDIISRKEIKLNESLELEPMTPLIIELK